MTSAAPRPATPTPPGRPDPLYWAAWLVRWLDQRYIDPILGFLLPGAGDLISSALGLYMVGIALHRRTPPLVVARMLLNLGVDALVGAIPILGDLFDIVFKANARNLALLEARQGKRHAQPSDWLVVGGALLLFLLALSLPVALLVWALNRLLAADW